MTTEQSTTEFVSSHNAQAERVRATRETAANNASIDRQQYRYAIIVAVDLQRGFSKAGEIPWNYPTDLKWFNQQTDGHICVMGRYTYEDINKRLGEKAKDSILPGRKCFVLSSKDDVEYTNATQIRSLSEVEKHLTDDDENKTIFFIGGDRVFQEALSKVQAVYMTVVNEEHQCDLFFNTQFLEKNFSVYKVYKVDEDPQLRFLIWTRRFVHI